MSKFLENNKSNKIYFKMKIKLMTVENRLRQSLRTILITYKQVVSLLK